MGFKSAREFVYPKWVARRFEGVWMGKLIGYARVSTKQQDTDRQEQDLRAAGVRRDDLYIDHGFFWRSCEAAFVHAGVVRAGAWGHVGDRDS